MSFLSSVNNVHVGFLNNVPLFWLPDGGDLHSLITNESKLIPKKAQPNHLLLGNAEDGGALLLNIDSCVIQFLNYIGGLYDNEEIEEIYAHNSKLREIYSVVESVSTTLDGFDEDELNKNTEKKAIYNFSKLNLDINYLSVDVLSNIHASIHNIFNSNEKGYYFDFKQELQLAVGAFIVSEMPLDYCISSPELRAFAVKANAYNLDDLLSERGLQYLSLFSGTLRYNLQGKWNNKKGQTTWGFGLTDWYVESIKKIKL
ncbi:MAG: hypothetical protein RSN61_21330 [Chryseobacterium sp.]|uniref:hypothetical protein n=1 Tax=Chryseobacterium sp. TaxID=1871047 RepID=UPI002FCCB6B3